MIKAIKAKLYPTKSQEELLLKSAGAARFAYNWGLAYSIEYHERHKNDENKKTQYISNNDLRKIFRKLKEKKDYVWLKEISADIGSQALIDLKNGLSNFFSGKGYPKFKRKHNCRVSFYHDPRKFRVEGNKIYITKIGFIKMRDDNRLPRGPYRIKDEKGQYKCAYSITNPRITYDGKDWYVSMGFEIQKKREDLKNFSLGIDLGIKELAVCSSGTKFKNVNKSAKVRKLKKRLKREQRKLSRKLENNIERRDKNGKPIFKRALKECANYNKQKKMLNKIYKKLNDIRRNHTHQTTSAIVKTKPSRIVMENLNVIGMMKNRHLAKAIQEQNFYEFVRQIKYKCEEKGIKVILADRWFPSSKRCSRCGSIKEDLKLSDRTYICGECGFVIDRDYNASINLANYNELEYSH